MIVDYFNLLILLITGWFSGIYVGIASGTAVVFMIPILTIIIGSSIYQAIGTSLFVDGIIGLIAGIIFLKKGNVKLKPVITLAICGTIAAFIGTRFGRGEVFHDETDSTTSKTTLFSLTGGLIIPVYIKNKLSIYASAGVGYGQWWDYRFESETKEGYELEAGLMISYNRLMINLSANRLDGVLADSKFDFTIGLGYRFSSIKMPHIKLK